MRSTSVLLILLQLTPAYGFQSQIEMVRVGKFSENLSLQLPIIEKKIQRSIENRPSIQARVVSEDLKLTKIEYQEFFDDQQFRRYIKKLKISGLEEEEMKVFRGLQEKLLRMGRSGSSVQESLFAEAYAHWKNGQKSEADRILTRALKLHPEGAGDYLSDWSEAEREDNSTLAFGLLLESRRSRITRGCEIRFINTESNQNLLVNGFRLLTQKVHHFQTGQVYRVSRGPGYEPSLVSCGQQAKLRVALSETREPYFAIEDFLKRAATFLFVREADKRITVDAYSSAGGMQKGFLIFEMEEGKEHRIPESKIEELARQHHLTSVDLAMVSALRPNPQPLVSYLAEGAEKPWYKSWVFWTISGVVAAGTATYFLTRNGGNPTVGTNITGIKISVE